jgi:short-subunit dehydrogenase
VSLPYSVAAVTGASTGIGRALALELARHGCRVGLLARRRDLLQETADAIRAAGSHATVNPCDVTDRAQVAQAVNEVTRALGPVDLLIANAGMGRAVPVGRFDGRLIAEMYQVNVLGAIYAIEAVLPSMLERRHGHIAGVASLAGYRGFPATSVYCATKAAMITQLEGLRVELAAYGVRVTTVCPGFVRTPMTGRNSGPMPFLLEPEDAARRIVRAIRRGRRVYNFPWPLALALWLVRRLPNPVYDRLARPREPGRPTGPPGRAGR